LTQDDPARALIAPFTLPQDWDPIPGTCSRCHRPALLTETGWHHDGHGCDPRKAGAARFIPDDPM
jgi:hypothetical protein